MHQTFSQLCSFDYTTKTVQIQKAPWSIQDKPRFAYRGLMLGKPQCLEREINIQCAILYYRKRILLIDTYGFLIIYFADTSRHYLPISVIKQVIESMSYAKLVR